MLTPRKMCIINTGRLGEHNPTSGEACDNQKAGPRSRRCAAKAQAVTCGNFDGHAAGRYSKNRVEVPDIFEQWVLFAITATCVFFHNHICK